MPSCQSAPPWPRIVVMLHAAAESHVHHEVEPGPKPCTPSAIMLTTEGRMTRAGMSERERLGHRRAIGRVTRDIGADAGMAARRSVEVFAELRRVLGSDAGART